MASERPHEPAARWDESGLGVSPNGDQGSPVVREPRVEPAPPEAPPRRRLPSRAVAGACLVVALVAVLWALGPLDLRTGPDPDEVEDRIAEDAAAFGVEASVQCPENAAATEAGETFTCVARAPNGSSVTIEVLNDGDTYAWDPQPLAQLARNPS